MERRTLIVRIDRRRFIIGLAVLLIGVLVPTVAIAAGGSFVDDDTSVFEADIEWLAGAGVTRGCNPPTNDRFCPNDEVTRGQMAAFMRRFARFLGAEDGVVGSADHAHSSGLALAAEDAYKLDGYDAEDLIQVSWCGVYDAPNGADYNCAIWMDVPVDGGVVVNASAETWLMSGSDDFYCDLTLDDANIVGSTRQVRLNATDGTYQTNCTSTAGTWVSAGTHWIRFRIFNVGPATGINGVGATAVFSPFVPGGSILGNE
jgi:hypothetical protein